MTTAVVPITDEVRRVFPDALLVKSTLKETELPTDDAPPGAERDAVLEGLRQAYAMLAAQRRFCNPAKDAHALLGIAMEHISEAAKEIKG